MLKSSDFRVRVHTLNRPQRIYTVVYIPGPSTYWVVDAGEEEGDIPFRWEAHPASAGDHQRRAAHRLARTVDEAEVATAATTARGVVVAGSRCFCRKLRHWRGRRGPTPDSMCKHNGVDNGVGMKHEFVPNVIIYYSKSRKRPRNNPIPYNIYDKTRAFQIIFPNLGL